jgi:hypothetical protein
MLNGVTISKETPNYRRNRVIEKVSVAGNLKGMKA